MRDIPANTDEESDPICWLKLVHPLSGWTWYVTTAEKTFGGEGDILFFGFVRGDYPESGTFTRDYLAEVGKALSFPVLREIDYTPQPLDAVIADCSTKELAELSAEYTQRLGIQIVSRPVFGS